MGVPTITLAGSHYVSRMSTSVLAGANMPDWIAHTAPYKFGTRTFFAPK